MASFVQFALAPSHHPPVVNYTEDDRHRYRPTRTAGRTAVPPPSVYLRIPGRIPAPAGRNATRLDASRRRRGTARRPGACPPHHQIGRPSPLPPSTFKSLAEPLRLQPEMQLGLMRLGPEEDPPADLELARHTI